MIENYPHVSVIILNWNGWQDTIECLESVLKSDYQNFNIILVDNHSDDDSIERIRDWANGTGFENITTNIPKLVFPLSPKPVEVTELAGSAENNTSTNLESGFHLNIRSRQILLLRNDQNSGFAIANNWAIKRGMALFNSKYFYLLNNDTVVEKNAISIIVNEMNQRQLPVLITSAIYDYYRPDVISNLGGKLYRWGNRKYYTSPQTSTNHHRISFITGCAIMIPRSIIDSIGFLSEKFFFGEEDFELSLRMKANNIKMICLFSSRVFHKVSVASKKLIRYDLQQKLLYFFNRSINLRDHYPGWMWQIWRFFISLYSVFWLKLKFSVSMKKGLQFSKYLYYCTNIFKDARKTTVEHILKNMPF